MSLCENCKISISKYECQICNSTFCLRCDSYIHSFPPNRSHLRKYISYVNQNDNTYQLNSNLNPSDNPTKNDIQDNNILLSNKIAEKEDNEFNCDYDNDSYSKKISCLGNEIMDAKENFENKIEALHEQFHAIAENQKQKMNELNEKNMKEINLISSEKDIQIQRLKEILEEQNQIINQLKEENNNLTMIYNKNLEEIDVIKASKENITKENEQVEKMNKDKIEEILEMNEEEKKRLIDEYNEELIKLKEKYNSTEEHLENAYKEKQKSINDLMEEKEKEENDLNFMIDNLKLNNKNKEKEAFKLKQKNEELQKVYDDRETQYKSMKEVVVKDSYRKNNK